MTYINKLRAIIKKNKSNLVIGLDTDIIKIPKIFLKYKNPVFEFNKKIINITKNFVAGYKINTAFYEADGAKGIETLERTAKYIPIELIKICDAKRGDIENTDEYYAKAFFDKMNFDAITFHPYMGKDSFLPFLKRKNKFIYVLALTSNPGANDFQKLKTGKKYLYEQIIETTLNWSSNQIGFVIGANHIEFLKKFTSTYKNIPILIPGIGAQGNDLEMLLKNINNNLYLVNASRSIIYSAGKDCTMKEFEKSVLNGVFNFNFTSLELSDKIN